MEDLTLRDAAGRLARFLLELPQSKRTTDGIVKLPGLKHYVASHLNLTSETFSRTCGGWSTPGSWPSWITSACNCSSPRSCGRWPRGCFPSCRLQIALFGGHVDFDAVPADEVGGNLLHLLSVQQDLFQLCAAAQEHDRKPAAAVVHVT